MEDNWNLYIGDIVILKRENRKMVVNDILVDESDDPDWEPGDSHYQDDIECVYWEDGKIKFNIFSPEELEISEESKKIRLGHIGYTSCFDAGDRVVLRSGSRHFIVERAEDFYIGIGDGKRWYKGDLFKLVGEEV